MDLDLLSLARLFQSCNAHNSIHQGKQLHLLSLKKGLLNSAIRIGNHLLQMYSRCGSMGDAQKLFEEMPQRNCFSWNTMIEGYLKSGQKEKSLELFNLMPHRNDFSWNVVILGFTKSGELEIARSLLNDMPRKNGVAWNSVIHGYVGNGCPEEAVRLFKYLNSEVLEEFRHDTFVLATVLGACTALSALECGRQIHARVLIDQVEFDSVLSTSLINLYGKCGDLDSASNILNTLEDPNEFSLSALISGYASCRRMNEAREIFHRKVSPSLGVFNSMISGFIFNNEYMEALALFNVMRRSGVSEDSSTLTSILCACSSIGILEHGKQMHAHICKVGLLDNIIVASALVDTYSKCGSPNNAGKLFNELKTHDTILLNTMIKVYSNCGRIDDAKQIFQKIPKKSLISWNSMIVGLSQNGCPIEALDMFCEMNRADLRMDQFSLGSIISACASISSLELGEQVFAKAIVIGIDRDQVISTSLIDFYCKCGFLETGRKIFDGMIKSDEISWNSMLMGYSMNGHASEALTLFDEMRRAGIRLTDITFIAVLSACDHCGLVEEGWTWFNAMKSHYDINPGIEHYSCMVDLLARAGRLVEAVKLIQGMPFEADTSIWSSILRGCVAHKNKFLGDKVASHIIELDPENSGAYVQLSSMFATSGDWEQAALVRKVMREKQVKKSPAYSWS